MFAFTEMPRFNLLGTSLRWNAVSIASLLISVAPFIATMQSARATTTQSGAAPVPARPTISAQPQSLVVEGGSPATFSLTVRSATPVKYQWYRRSAMIPGATSDTYSEPAVALQDSGANYKVTVTNAAGVVWSSLAWLTVNAVPSSKNEVSGQRPFSDSSPWNARPTRFSLGSFEVPKSSYYPTVASGAYSVGAFIAVTTDGPMTIKGTPGRGGIYIADAEMKQDHITLPHWPSNVTPATGGDGHADIVDIASNKIHSFYQLKQIDGQWTATQYAWTALDGRGWGSPGAYMQGARATGVVPIAGIIRINELDDGKPAYSHALAMSMTNNALSGTQPFIFPATSADANARSRNTGVIPEGALMMLPANFDVSAINDARLLKIVRTLQSFGAYVVDENSGTPFALYVESGNHFSLMQPNHWDGEIARELDLIRSGLRQVLSASEWVDAKGARFTPEKNLNLLSMRGGWWVLHGTAPGVFDTWQQAVVFPDSGTQITQINATGRSMPPNPTTDPQAGQMFKLAVNATGGATLKLDLTSQGRVIYSSGFLENGQTVDVRWPATGLKPYVTVSSNKYGGGTVSATLIRIEN